MNRLWIVLSDICQIIKGQIKFILICIIIGAALLWPYPVIAYYPLMGIPIFIIMVALAMSSHEKW